MIKQFILGTSLLIGISTFAQEKTTVAILPFTFSQSTEMNNVNSIQEEVINSFVKTKRFTIVDRSKTQDLKNEREGAKSEESIDSKALIEQGVSLGAQFLISGHVISAKAERMTADDGKGHVTYTFKANLSISLKVIDVSTGQISSSETIEPKAGNSMLGMIGIGATSPEQAITKAIKDISGKVDKFVSKNFPVSFSVVEVQEKDGLNAKTVLISGGSGFGLKKGQKLKVVEISQIEVNGKKMNRRKSIGELKINKVDDENFSICSVTSGGGDINTKFEAKSKLEVETLE